MRYGLTNIEYLYNILVYLENTVDLNPFMDRMKKQCTFKIKPRIAKIHQFWLEQNSLLNGFSFFNE